MPDHNISFFKGIDYKYLLDAIKGDDTRQRIFHSILDTCQKENKQYLRTCTCNFCEFYYGNDPVMPLDDSSLAPTLNRTYKGKKLNCGNCMIQLVEYGVCGPMFNYYFIEINGVWDGKCNRAVMPCKICPVCDRGLDD